MTTTNFQIGQQVTFNNSIAVNVITEIKGKSAVTFEKATGLTYTKRLTSLIPYVLKLAYWGEQDLAQANYQHGQTVFSMISKDQNNSKLVWDSIKKDCVTIDNLTK